MMSGRLALVVAALVPGTAAAQQGANPPKWEIEVHGGGAFVSTSPDGTSYAIPLGAPFTSTDGTPSRRVWSWYLGDGAALLNEVNAALRTGASILPLDRVLTAPLARQPSGGTCGIRVARDIRTRLTAEFSAEYPFGRQVMSDEVQEAIEESHASFTAAWTALLRAGAFPAPGVTTALDLRSRGRVRSIATIALNVRFRTEHRFVPYVGVGIGAMGGNRLDPPRMELEGAYHFRTAEGAAINERDFVRIRVSEPGLRATGVAAGGFRYSRGGRWGVRVDIRDHFSRNRVDTLVSALPLVAMGSPPAVVTSATAPAIQFSNTTAPLSSLGGFALDNFRAFESRGTEHSVSITAGVFRRF